MLRRLALLTVMVALATPLGLLCPSTAQAAPPCPMADCHDAVSAACCCAERPAPPSDSRETGLSAGPRDPGLTQAHVPVPVPAPAATAPASHASDAPHVPRPPLYLLHASFLV